MKEEGRTLELISRHVSEEGEADGIVSAASAASAPAAAAAVNRNDGGNDGCRRSPGPGCSAGAPDPSSEVAASASEDGKTDKSRAYADDDGCRDGYGLLAECLSDDDNSDDEEYKYEEDSEGKSCSDFEGSPPHHRREPLFRSALDVDDSAAIEALIFDAASIDNDGHGVEEVGAAGAVGAGGAVDDEAAHAPAAAAIPAVGGGSAVAGGETNSTLFSIALPSNLHPATSMGMRRVSSMRYFSVGSRLSEMDSHDEDYRPVDHHHQQQQARMPQRSSNAELMKLARGGSDDEEEKKSDDDNGRLDCGAWPSNIGTWPPSSSVASRKDPSAIAGGAVKWNAVDVLYHDVMMRIFAYLPLRSLAAFSETSRRANFECFYFLQLQLQGALLDGMTTGTSPPSSSHATWPGRYGSSGNDDGLPAVEGAGAISRLASMDQASSQGIVNTYLESNSTLETMPLSHSLAYLRRALLRHGFHIPGGGGGGGGRSDDGAQSASANANANAVANAARAAALAVTLLGAASYVHSGGEMPHMPDVAMSEEYAVALRDGLLKIGLAGGLMRAGAEVAAKVHHHEEEGENDSGGGGGGSGGGHPRGGGVAVQMRETAEQLARMLQGHFPRMHQHQPRQQESGSSEEAMAFPSSIAARLYGAFASQGEEGQAAATEEDHPSSHRRRQHRGQRSRFRPRERPVAEGSEGESEGEGDVTASSSSAAGPSAAAEGPGVLSADAHDDVIPAGAGPFVEPSVTELRAMERPAGPDPYEHDSFTGRTGDSSSGSDSPAPTDSGEDSSSTDSSGDTNRRPFRKKPSGCVGAYYRSVRSARREITNLVKRRRRANFDALNEDDRIRTSMRFIDACGSDDTLGTVRELVQVRAVVDVDGFYVGSDGTETCGLHAASFHGAEEVVRFLTAPVDDVGRWGCGADGAEGGGGGGGEDRDGAPPTAPYYLDGGACDVNLRDGNGWTAAHFAAGADAVPVLRALAEAGDGGAELTAEASNGYTPYHWAQRLGNDGAAAVLAELGADNRFLEVRWMFGGGNGGSPETRTLSAFLVNRMRALMAASD